MLIEKQKSLMILVLMSRLKCLFAAVIQCMPLVALVTRHKFMREPHLSGVVRITHFVHDDVIILRIQFITNKSNLFGTKYYHFLSLLIFFTSVVTIVSFNSSLTKHNYLGTKYSVYYFNFCFVTGTSLPRIYQLLNYRNVVKPDYVSLQF